MKKKITRRITWFCWRVVFIALAIWGVAFDFEKAANLLKFLIWLIVPLLILGAFSEKLRAEKRENGPSVPPGLVLAVDLAIASLMAACGWFGYAAFFMVGSMCAVGVYLAKPDAVAVSTGEQK